MADCPHCGAALETDEARFCSTCGRSIDSAASDLMETAETMPRSKAGGRDSYARAVREVISDGLVDSDDRRVLDAARQDLRLSVEEAAEVEAETMDELTAPAASGETADGPILLEINDNHFYMANMAAVADCRLTNRSDESSVNLRLAIRGKFLGVAEHTTASLAARQTGCCRLQFVPEIAGEHVVDLTLTGEVDGKPRVWVAQIMLKVLAQSDNPSSVTLNIDQSMKAGGNLGYGLSNRTQIADGIASGLIKDVNDLIRQTLPEHWQPIALHPDEELTRGARAALPKRVRVLRKLADRHTPMRRATLMLGEGDDAHRVHLLGMRRVRLGRGRSFSDVVLRRLPRSTENDALTLQITGSRPHAILSVTSEGLTLTDKKSTNGIFIGDKRVDGVCKLPLDRSSEIDVAKSLRLRVTPFFDEADEAAADRYADLGEPDEFWDIAGKLGLRSVLIQRLDNLAAEESYLLICRWATVGRGAASELNLPGADLQRAHARIVRRGGGFWIESLAGRDHVAADGRNLGRGKASPLAAEMTLKLGEAALSVHDFEQYGM